MITSGCLSYKCIPGVMYISIGGRPTFAVNYMPFGSNLYVVKHFGGDPVRLSHVYTCI